MIKKCPQYELRTLLFTLLNNAISYSGTIVPVFESLPKGLELPYIVVGMAEADSSGDESKGNHLDEYTIHIDVYTAYGGTLENCAILSDVYEVLGEAVETRTMQFLTGSDFCMTIFDFGHVSTEVTGNNNIFPDLLEQSSLELKFTIEQLLR